MEIIKNDDALLYGIADAAEQMPEHVPAGKEYWLDRFPAERGYRFWMCKSPIRMYPGCELPKTLTQSEKGTIYDCAMLMETGTNMLFHRVNGYNKPLSVKKLAERLGKKERQTYNFLKRMYELRIFACEDGRIYVNPIYFFRGTYLSSHLFFLFEEDLASVLPEPVVKKYYNMA